MYIPVQNLHLVRGCSIDFPIDLAIYLTEESSSPGRFWLRSAASLAARSATDASRSWVRRGCQILTSLQHHCNDCKCFRVPIPIFFRTFLIGELSWVWSIYIYNTHTHTSTYVYIYTKYTSVFVLWYTYFMHIFFDIILVVYSLLSQPIYITPSHLGPGDDPTPTRGHSDLHVPPGGLGCRWGFPVFFVAKPWVFRVFRGVCRGV